MFSFSSRAHIVYSYFQHRPDTAEAIPPMFPELGRNNVGVWLVEQRAFTATQLYQFEQWLTLEERTRYDNFLLEKNRTQFLIGRGLTRRLLGHFTRTPPSELVLQISKQGKPFLRGSEFSFSISHSGDYIAVALALSRPVGIDIECTSRGADTDQLLRISRQFFSSREHRELCDLAVPSQSERFFSLWTLKEAYVKALGFGLSIPLSRPVFHFPSVGHISFEDISNHESWFFSGCQISDYIFALACQGSPAEIVFCSMSNNHCGSFLKNARNNLRQVLSPSSGVETALRSS